MKTQSSCPLSVDRLFAHLIFSLGVSEAHDNKVVHEFITDFGQDEAWVLRQLEYRLSILTDTLH
jgi:hypothetical protein